MLKQYPALRRRTDKTLQTAWIKSAYRTEVHLTLAGPCIIIQFKYTNQPDAIVLQVYYLTFCVAQHVSRASMPIIRSLQLH